VNVAAALAGRLAAAKPHERGRLLDDLARMGPAAAPAIPTLMLEIRKSSRAAGRTAARRCERRLAAGRLGAGGQCLTGSGGGAGGGGAARPVGGDPPAGVFAAVLVPPPAGARGVWYPRADRCVGRPEPAVSSAAAESLRHFGPAAADAAPALAARLSDPAVAVTVARALAAITGDERAVPALIGALSAGGMVTGPVLESAEAPGR
jgi:hypothetical protein